MSEELKNISWRVMFTDQTGVDLEAAYIYESPVTDSANADRCPVVLKNANHKIVLWAPQSAVQYVERLPADGEAAPRICGWTCQHMSMTGDELGKPIVECGCDVQPIYANQ